jgi:iron complex outermembrane recepter protein
MVRILPKTDATIGWVAAFTLAVVPDTAWAQRADENAATAAEDGFGKSVGEESVGIYASGDVRGFSAYDAGNARIEGLYFNESGALIGLVQSASDIRLGLTAFGQPFPAPTGIVDTSLARVTEDRTIVSARASVGPYSGYFGVLEAAVPVTATLGLNGGVSDLIGPGLRSSKRLTLRHVIQSTIGSTRTN